LLQAAILSPSNHLGKFGATHPYQCLEGFARNDCSNSLWMYPEYCNLACNEFATPDDPNATATTSRTRTFVG